MTTRDRELRPSAPLCRTAAPRRARASVSAALLAVTFAFATTGSAALASTPPGSHASSSGIPGYNPAAIDRAIQANTKTLKAIQKQLHPGRKHGKKHPRGH